MHISLRNHAFPFPGALSLAESQCQFQVLQDSEHDLIHQSHRFRTSFQKGENPTPKNIFNFLLPPHLCFSPLPHLTGYTAVESRHFCNAQSNSTKASQSSHYASIAPIYIYNYKLGSFGSFKPGIWPSYRSLCDRASKQLRHKLLIHLPPLAHNVCFWQFCHISQGFANSLAFFLPTWKLQEMKKKATLFSSSDKDFQVLPVYIYNHLVLDYMRLESHMSKLKMTQRL